MHELLSTSKKAERRSETLSADPAQVTDTRKSDRRRLIDRRGLRGYGAVGQTRGRCQTIRSSPLVTDVRGNLFLNRVSHSNRRTQTS
jgi:hypothetical protein